MKPRTKYLVNTLKIWSILQPILGGKDILIETFGRGTKQQQRSIHFVEKYKCIE